MRSSVQHVAIARAGWWWLAYGYVGDRAGLQVHLTTIEPSNKRAMQEKEGR